MASNLISSFYNPYGAVPDALSEARRTLKDISDDQLVQKKIAAEREIGLARLATDKSRVEAEIERNRAARELDLAKFGFMRERSLADEAMKREEMGIRRSDSESMGRLRDAQTIDLAEQRKLKEREFGLHARESGARMALIGERLKQMREQNTPKTWAEHAKDAGMPAQMLSVFGINPSDTTTATHAAKAFEGTIRRAQQDPAFLANLSAFQAKSLWDKAYEAKEWQRYEKTDPRYQQEIGKLNALRKQFEDNAAMAGLLTTTDPVKMAKAAQELADRQNIFYEDALATIKRASSEWEKTLAIMPTLYPKSEQEAPKQQQQPTSPKGDTLRSRITRPAGTAGGGGGELGNALARGWEAVATSRPPDKDKWGTGAMMQHSSVKPQQGQQRTEKSAREQLTAKGITGKEQDKWIKTYYDRGILK